MFSDLPFANDHRHHATRAHLHSARPDAPVVVDEPRTPRLAALRAHLAGGLHRTADRVAPRTAPPRAHARLSHTGLGSKRPEQRGDAWRR